MDTFRAAVGAPELEVHARMAVKVSHHNVRVTGQHGLRGLGLSQVDGVVLALDWIKDGTHRVWGSAVMVAPGVALTARHVVDEMRDKGFLSPGGGYLTALGFHESGLVIWNALSFSAIGEGDLAILTLARATREPALSATDPAEVNAAIMAVCEPELGEEVTFIGYVATEEQFDDLGPNRQASILLQASLGSVTDVYSDYGPLCRGPSFGVAAETTGGMSGGGAFDSKGRLIGIVSAGIDNHSFGSMCWPCIYAPLSIPWPPELVQGTANLHSLAGRDLARIENLAAVRAGVDERGVPRVSLFAAQPAGAAIERRT